MNRRGFLRALMLAPIAASFEGAGWWERFLAWASTPRYGQLALKFRQLTARVPVSNDLIRYGFLVPAEFSRDIIEGLRKTHVIFDPRPGGGPLLRRARQDEIVADPLDLRHDTIGAEIVPARREED